MRIKIIYNDICTAINKIGFINRSPAWQILQKLPGRLVRIQTKYKKNKIAAIKNYVKNDIENVKIKKEINSYQTEKYYDFRGIKLPLSTIISADSFLNVIKPNIENLEYTPEDIKDFYDVQKNKFKTLTYWRDNCQSDEIDFYGNIVSHGFTYFFKEVTVKENDIVIDLGAAPGDFSAVCAQKKASVIYAFEPDVGGISNLKEVNRMNGNKIEMVEKYCDKETDLALNSISLDDFAKKNNLTKIDFIKADIEGAEAKALSGARNILKNYKPKLAFCTYHKTNNADEIEKIILKTNPEYKIYKQNGIIYAF